MVDVRGALAGVADWADEIHATSGSFAKVAARFRTTLREAGKATGDLILTVEDHSDCGGIGEAVAGAVSPAGIRVHRLAVSRLPRSGKPEELLAAHHIDRTAIVAKVKSLL